MNRFILRIVVFCTLITTLSFSFIISVKASETADAVYFGSYGCMVCQSLENSGVLQQLEAEGYTMKRYMSEDNYDLFEEMFARYARTYNVSKNKNQVPILYAGGSYYIGVEAIQTAIRSGRAQKAMDLGPLLEPVELIYGDITFKDLIMLSGSTFILGILDAFNPCALAMLLMFLSFLTDKKRSKVIVYICVSYIVAVFITYFVLGVFLAKALAFLLPYMKIFYSVIILLALIISVINFMDFYQARRKNYDGIKNQLPSRFFLITRKIMTNFSEKIDNEKGIVYAFAFIIGVFVAIVEFPCSGQAFVAWTAIVVDRTSHVFIFNLLLSIYVLFFVSPLIVISFIGLRAKNINLISNFVRNRLDIIKLANGIVFLGIAIYYFYKVFIGGIS